MGEEETVGDVIIVGEEDTVVDAVIAGEEGRVGEVVIVGDEVIRGVAVWVLETTSDWVIRVVGEGVDVRLLLD